MRLNAIERLARRICWLGFSPAVRPPEGEVGYWNAMPWETRDRYIRDAKYFAGMLSNLQRSERSYQIVADAQILQAALMRKPK